MAEVLVIDDENDIFELIESFLKKDGTIADGINKVRL